MAHPKEHPLADRVVVPSSGLARGERVTVIGWIDGMPSFRPLSARAAAAGRMVLVRDSAGHHLMPADDLPAYDPEPVGFVS